MQAGLNTTAQSHSGTRTDRRDAVHRINPDAIVPSFLCVLRNTIKVSVCTLFLLLHINVMCGQQVMEVKYAQDVFNKLVRTINQSSPPKPILEIVPDPDMIAETSGNGTIMVGYGLIERCRTFGKDSGNALAHVLSHELTHYYSGHFWSDQFGSAYANIGWGEKITASGKSMDAMRVYETQADEYGMYYAFAAGYRTLYLGDKVLDSIYTWYRLQEQLPGYPSLVERKLIALSSRKNIASLIPVFETGNLCLTLAQTMSGEQQAILAKTAALQFDDILARKILTKEMYNNAAVARMLSVLHLLPDSVQSIRFPFMLESGSMLYRSERSRSNGQQLDSAQLMLIEEELEATRSLLLAAVKMDKQFYPAHVNLAILAFLQGNMGTASDALQSASRAMGEQHPLIWAIYEMRGIIRFAQLQEIAPELFHTAVGKGSVTAIYNLALLDRKSDPKMLMSMQASMHVPFATDTTEMAEGSSVFQLLDRLPANRIGRFDLLNEQTVLFADTSAAYTYFYVRSNFQPSFNKLRFMVLNDEANISTSKGLKRGDRVDTLEKYYGVCTQTILESNATIYHYPAQNLFVWVDDGKVVKWGYWWMK